MASGAVLLGAWISHAQLSMNDRILLALAAFFSTAFGNIINDIIDIDSDRISHCDRPLPRSLMTITEAWIYCIFCAAAALSCAFLTVPLYGFATLLPLALLAVYAFYLKGTPLAGNVIVSLLVSYSLLFSSLEAIYRTKLFIPALLAMLLNFSREIIKDLQDSPGDQAAGVTTTASLPLPLLRNILFCCSGTYAFLLFVPFLTGMCGKGYLLTVIFLVVPLHAIRLFFLIKSDWTCRYALFSKLLKFEMLSGLLALAIDRIQN